jgi:NADH dehydrogenase FAD-containing subunit
MAGPAQTVLVLGDGVGGVAAANRLRRRLDRQHRVVLVNREDDFSFAASYLRVMTGARRRAGVFAHAQAHAVADTIAATITGSGETGRFNGHGGCFIETGNGRAAYGPATSPPTPPPSWR